MMQPPLVITLSKARPKGSKNKRHKYLFRYLKPDGTWEHVYPRREDGIVTPEGQLKLHPGRTIAGVINDALFGGPTGNKLKDGVTPEVRDGKFLRYEVVSENDYRRAVSLAQRYNKPNPFRKNALSVKKIDGFFVFAYPKVSVIERDENGKPTRLGGWTSMEFHPSIVGAGYNEARLPAKITAYRVTDPEHIQRVHDTMTGAAIPKGKFIEGTPTIKPGTERALAARLGIKGPLVERPEGVSAEATITPMLGERSILTAPVDPHAGLPPEEHPVLASLTEEMDPIKYAADLYERMLHGRKSPAGGVKRVRLADFPAWVRAKYDNDEQLFLEKLQKQPATTLVSIGAIKPTRSSKRLNEALAREWLPVALGIARDNAGALSETKTWRTLEALDAKARAEWEEKRAREIEAGVPSDARTDFKSKVRKFRNDITRDMMQQGLLRLHQEALAYTVKKEDPRDRFDRKAYTAIQTTIRNYARDEAARDHSLVPFVDEGAIETEQYKVISKPPLTPEEAVELEEAAKIAIPKLSQILFDMPETYRRVIAARLWLDDPAAEERKLAKQGRRLETQIQTAAELGTTIERRKREDDAWRRDWTGKHGIVEANPIWKRPDTGEEIDLSTMSPNTQRRLLSTWYDEAIAYVLRRISAPIKRTEPAEHSPAHIPEAEWRSRAGRVEVPVAVTSMSPEERIVHAALGVPTTETHVLTHEGKAIVRYLQLEQKLAAANRQRWKQAEHKGVYTTRVLPPPKGATAKTQRVLYVPPYEITHPTTKTPVTRTVAPVHPQHEAVAFFTSSKNQALAARLGLHPSHLGAESTGLFGTPNVSLGLRAQRFISSAEHHHKRLMALAKEAGSRIDSRLKTASKKLATIDRARDEILPELHRAAQNYLHVSAELDAKRARRSEIKKIWAGDAKLKDKLAPHLTTDADKARLQSAFDTVQGLISKMEKVVPAAGQVYRNVLKNRVEHHVADEQAHTAIQRQRRPILNDIALLEFEQQRRAALAKIKVTKGDTLTTFVKAWLDYDFELGRLHAEMSA